MKRSIAVFMLFAGFAPLLTAETNALVEVVLFKNWKIKNEWNFGNLTIQNTGSESFLLAKTADDFDLGQLSTRSLDNKLDGPPGGTSYDKAYEGINMFEEGFQPLAVGEKRVYEGRRFLLPVRVPFAETMHFKVSVYLGNGTFIDSSPLTVNGVVPDSEEYVATVINNKFVKQGKKGVYPKKLVAVTYKTERWLYSTSVTGGGYYPICPVSLKGKLHVEPYNNAELFKIWDEDKSMIYNMYSNLIVEGPEENDVLGKWTREKKNEVKAHNEEVRRRQPLKEK